MTTFDFSLLSGFIFFSIFAASLTLTGLIRLYTLKRQIVDVPNERSSHTGITPRGGGLAIFMLVTVGTIILWQQGFIVDELAAAIVIGGSAIGLLGWCDDIYHLRSLTRLIIQVLASMLSLFLLDDSSTIAQFIFDLLIIVWSINLYNFMDGIDGLAGAEGLFISLITGLLLAFTTHYALALFCWLIAGAIAGFLFWNWSPAKIFMGDVGSAYLGFIFSLFSISTMHQQLLPISYWMILSAVFIGDATFTLLMRMLKRQKWWAAHKQHAYQCLHQFGYSHRLITGGISIFNFFILLPLALFAYYSQQPAIVLVAATGIVVFCLWFAIIKYKRGVDR